MMNPAAPAVTGAALCTSCGMLVLTYVSDEGQELHCPKPVCLAPLERMVPSDAIVASYALGGFEAVFEMFQPRIVHIGAQAFKRSALHSMLPLPHEMSGPELVEMYGPIVPPKK